MADELTYDPEIHAEPVVALTARDRLRQHRRELQEERVLHLDVPGYKGDLVAAYHPLDWKTVKGIQTRMQQGRSRQGQKDRAELNAQIDTIIAATTELLYRDEYGKLLPLIGDETQVRWDRKLADIVGIPADDQTTARSILLQVFNNEVAVVGHHAELFLWLQGASDEIDEEILGE